MSATDSLVAEDSATKNRAWRELYDAQFDGVYRLIRRAGVGDLDAEDLAQKAFIVAHRRLHEVEGVENVPAWVCRIALNIVAQHYRWQRVRRLKAWVLPSTPGSASAPALDPEADASRIQMAQSIEQVLGAMSRKLRDVFVLTEIEEMRPQEVAEILDVPVNTVRSRRRLAVEDFRRRWQDATKESHHG